MKDIVFLGNTRKEISSWGLKPRYRAGHQLRKVQSGKEPSDYKPMSSIGTGVREIRIQSGGQWRVIYTAKMKVLFMFWRRFKRKLAEHPKG